MKNNRILTLYRILSEYTDEDHPISMADILAKMDANKAGCSADSIFRDMKQLRDDFGVDIISGRGRGAKYFIGDRLFQMEELKLLIDAVNASNFIEEDISEKIVNKLKSTVSIHERKKLDRTILGISATKAENKAILYNVNAIQDAIELNRQITFEYYHWNRKKELVRINSNQYSINPWALLWAYDRYYLFGYDVHEKDGKHKARNYRVDKIKNIRITEDERECGELFENFDADSYVSQNIGMWSLDPKYITAVIPEKIIGVFIDQFGKKIDIKDNENGTLSIGFKAVPQNSFYGWLMGLGGVKITSPEEVKEKYIELIKQNMESAQS